jgi:hypothetical protein
MSEPPEDKAKRARKRQRNLTAKYARKFNRAAVHRDRTKNHRDKYPTNTLQEALESPQRND